MSLGAQIVPYRLNYEQLRVEIRDGYHEWRRAFDETQPTFEIENVRFDHDPEWRYRLLSMQSARDGNYFVWKIARQMVMLNSLTGI